MSALLVEIKSYSARIMISVWENEPKLEETKILFCVTRSRIGHVLRSRYCHVSFHNYNNYWIVPFTSYVINRKDIAKICVEHRDFPWDDQCLIYFSVSMDLESVVRLSIFQTKIHPICKFPASQLLLVGAGKKKLVTIISQSHTCAWLLILILIN